MGCDSGARDRSSSAAAPFYAAWYPARWIPEVRRFGEFGRNARHMRYAARATNRLGRTLFHAMLAYEVTENITVRLNVDNIFNKQYAVSTDWNGSRATLGAPRTFLITTGFRF